MTTTVLDLARQTINVACASVANWTDTVRKVDMAGAYNLYAAVTPETHIPPPNDAGDNGVDNTLDAWVPHVEFDTFWLDSTPATARP